MSTSTITTQLHRHGFELVRQRKHRVYRRADGKQLVIPSTPSDTNWERNAIHDFARVLGTTKADLLHEPRRRRIRPPRIETIAPEPIPPAPQYSKVELKKLRRMERHERQREQKREKQREFFEWVVQLAREDLEADTGYDILSIAEGIEDALRGYGAQLRWHIVEIAKDVYLEAPIIVVSGWMLDVIAGCVREYCENWTWWVRGSGEQFKCCLLKGNV